MTMTFTVKLTHQAKQDLLNIAQYYLSKAGTDVAIALVDSIEQAVQTLQDMPERGHKPHELYQVPMAAILEIISKSYRIIYKLMDDQVVVVAIFDGRQDVKVHLLKRLASLH
jgi:toxin ParE1/3/4